MSDVRSEIVMIGMLPGALPDTSNVCPDRTCFPAVTSMSLLEPTGPLPNEVAQKSARLCPLHYLADQCAGTTRWDGLPCAR